MKSRYEAWMDGISLHSLHSDLTITDISHAPPAISRSVSRRAQGNGGFPTTPYQERSSVTISFELRIYNTRDRQNVCQEICRWAQGRILRTNDRLGQQLNCVCDAFPAIESAQRWTDTLSMVFSAIEIPFWQETNAASITLSGENSRGTLFVPGNAGNAFVDAEITAQKNITTLSMETGKTTITLAGISIPAGGIITVSHARGILGIKHGTASLLNKRTALSSDDLLIECGNLNEMSVSADVNCTYKARGLWL